MVEHRMYLPLAVVSAGVAALGSGLIGRHVARPSRLWVGTTMVIVVSLGLAVATWSRCHAYQSRLVMWADVVTKAPGNPRGWQTLALELWQAGVTERALEAVDRSLAIVPQAPMSQLTRAGILLDLGRAAEAVEAADRAIALDPRVGDAHRVREAAIEARRQGDGK
jgi:tetratricopeptide (TPR) repeat protein